MIVIILKFITYNIIPIIMKKSIVLQRFLSYEKNVFFDKYLYKFPFTK